MTIKALILIDFQNDYCDGDATAVKNADEVVAFANQLMSKFDVVVTTQDWHPANHESFAAMHPWRKPGQIIELHGLPQTLKIIHCVQESFGAMLHKDLNTEGVHHFIRKGMDAEVGSFSAFFDNGKRHDTGLNDFLKSKNVSEVHVLGLETDFSVKNTVADAIDLGFETHFIEL